MLFGSEIGELVNSVIVHFPPVTLTSTIAMEEAPNSAT